MLFVRLILQRAITDDMACRINIKCFHPNTLDRICVVPGQLSEVITLSVSLSHELIPTHLRKCLRLMNLVVTLDKEQ